MAMGNGNSLGGLNAEMNVTPLIDVLLVLLIIFMVIVPVTPRGLNAEVPQRSAKPDQGSAIVMQILSASSGQLRYKINQEDVLVNDLGRRLNAILSMRADKALFIKADSSLDFSTVAKIMDIGKGAGADHVGLITLKVGE